MGWGKALIMGFCTYLGLFAIGFLLFVQLGLGYKFSNLANKIASILELELGPGKNWNLFLSALFWTVIIAVVIKIISFYVKK